MTTTLPRLTEAICRQGCLSLSEAQAALDRFRHDDPEWRDWSGEAVCHYGGMTRLIRDAWRNRERIRFELAGRYRAERPQHGYELVAVECVAANGIDRIDVVHHTGARFCQECDSLYCENPRRHFAAGFVPTGTDGPKGLSALADED